jgi:hypothetical protein
VEVVLQILMVLIPYLAQLHQMAAVKAEIYKLLVVMVGQAVAVAVLSALLAVRAERERLIKGEMVALLHLLQVEAAQAAAVLALQVPMVSLELIQGALEVMA